MVGDISFFISDGAEDHTARSRMLHGKDSSFNRFTDKVAAAVSRGGRPDLAKEALPEVQAPVLLIVGGDDPEVLMLNKLALELLNKESRLEIVPQATHLFEEPGALELVAQLAAQWFEKHFT